MWGELGLSLGGFGMSVTDLDLLRSGLSSGLLDSKGAQKAGGCPILAFCARMGAMPPAVSWEGCRFGVSGH
jgi:hypothetical protein